MLLIACANVANLALARMGKRSHEFAVRATLGAGRGRLVRQLLTEGLVISSAAGLIGLVLAAVGLRALLYYADRFMPRTGEIHMDMSVLAFTIVASLGAGLAFTAMPAFAARRDVSAALGSGSRVAAGAQRARSALIALQVAGAFILLICAGLMLRTLVNLHDVDAGFNSQHLVSMRIDLNWSKYATPEQSKAFFDRLAERVDSNPEIISSAIASGVPLNGRPYFQTVALEGYPLPSRPGTPQADVTIVSKDYFKTMGVPILEGRGFTSADDVNAPPVVIVSATMAKHRWGAASPVGSRITLDDGKTWVEVVGVAGDVRIFGLASEFSDEIWTDRSRRHPSATRSSFERTRTRPPWLVSVRASVTRSIRINR